MGVVEVAGDAFAPRDSPEWLESSVLQPRDDPSPPRVVQQLSHAPHKTRQRVLPAVIRHHNQLSSNQLGDANLSSRPASLPSHLGVNLSSPSSRLQPATFSPFTQSVSPRGRSVLLPSMSSSHKLPSALPVAHAGTLGGERQGGSSTERQSAVERRKRMLALISTSRDEEVGGIINRPAVL